MSKVGERRSRTVAAIIAALCLAAFAAVPAAAATTTVVHIFDFDFSTNPEGQPIVDPTINVGDTIQWLFDDGDHSATSVAGLTESWDSGIPFVVGFTFDHTFTQTGAFPYYCKLHGFDNGDGTAGGMSGVINVVPEPSAVATLFAGALCSALAWRRRR